MSRKIEQCSGEGQGTCRRCKSMGKWNVNWMCFLYKVEGLEGCYCFECANVLAGAKRDPYIICWH